MIHKLNSKLTTVRKIVHLADIHIRLFKRHAEYKLVFDELYASLRRRDLTDTAIVLAGDVVHSKTDMSPEMVQVVSDFLSTLGDIAPTIVIPGNHDLNLANPNRLDALSPIIDNLNHTQLHYLTGSGIYQLGDVQFGVHSIIGSPDEWPSPSDMTSATKIGLYHAPVNKAQTDVGYTITNRVTVETFSGYDMVMLGDIHKSQILQEYEPGKPEIAYPGSLIQQNHGESITGHGYFVWDVATKKIEEFVEIKNDYGYFTLTVADNKTLPVIANMPANVRLRIFVGDVDASFIKKVQSVIRKKYNIIECTINKLATATSATKTKSANILDDIQNVEHQNEHITKFVANHFPGTDPDVLEKILEINTKLNSQIGEDELPKNINWRPMLLKFDNLFSYGEGNSINFADMKGLYGVFSPNASGKTSAFDAMCFALYDKTPRAFKGSHIMNTRRDDFSCELTFEIDQKQYVIERTGARKKNGEVKVDVDFYRMEGLDRISLNGEDRRDTNSAIRSYVGTYEDFILTALSVQNQNSLFIDTGQSDRKDLLSQFIGLTVFDRLFNLASDEIKEINGALKAFKKDDFSQRLATAQTDIHQLDGQYESVHEKLIDAKGVATELTAKINKLYEQKVPNVKIIDPKPVEHEKAMAELKLEMYQKEASTQKAEEHAIQSELASLPTPDAPNNPHTISVGKMYDEYLNGKDALERVRKRIQSLEFDVNSNKSKLANLSKHKYDPNCKFCMNNVFVKDAELTRQVYDTAIIALESARAQAENGEKYVESLSHVEDERARLKDAVLLVSRAETRLAEARLKVERAESGMSELNKEIDIFRLILKQYEDNKTIIENNAVIERRIVELEHDNTSINLEIAKFESHVLNINGKLQIARKQKDDMLQTIKEAEELETTYDAYETYLGVMGRDGLPYELISTVIPNLETEVNNTLAQIVDFTVALDVDGKNINGKIIYDTDRTWPLELASGMEKFISSLAIRVALMSVSNLPKSNFLVIDEGLGVLDADNLASMSMLFDMLTGKFEFIILISHLDTARDIADSLIEIKRDDGFSYINVD